ncbi:nitrilase-related carbon-nitrogen hydrolase [Lutibaculum baratangense]|uniref:Glutamine-dependent NAD(+) synthetase n=1 Tax=Lutibaculum baratangense AMV1 TaxID=631454 RepID=V4R9S3_9HYPH|nr:nitrilase-related carbon-nitrogen hydrolase [Lutibaculum baratangense]ESR22906.1 NAD synthetase [Lutibaculum baratangense AMV1]
MTGSLAIACAQLNPTVGDLAGNLEAARAARRAAGAQGAELVVLGEFSLSGAPLEGLARQPDFLDACRGAATALAADTADGGPAVLFGVPWRDGPRVFSAACLAEGGAVSAVQRKVLLSSAEEGIFDRGELPGPIRFRDVAIGVLLGDDLATEEVAECLEETGAELLVALTASSWHPGRQDQRLNAAVARVTESVLPLVWTNLVGGQDELVFDGASFGLNRDGSLAFQMAAFAEGVSLSRWRRSGEAWSCGEGERAVLAEGNDALRLACVLGLRDFVRKSGGQRALLPLADDAEARFAAAMAVEALGAENVSGFIARGSRGVRAQTSGAEAWAASRGVAVEVVDLAEASAALEAALGVSACGDGDQEPLVALALGIAAARRDEVPVTGVSRTRLLLGATAPGARFNPLKGLYAGEVAKLAGSDPVLARLPAPGLPSWAPTGLPDTVPLDDILAALFERGLGCAEVAESAGVEPAVVRQVAARLLAAEGTRRQAAPGPTFGRRGGASDMRLPIVDRWGGAKENKDTS